MRPPSFWWRDAGVWGRLLQPLGALYGVVAAHRLRRRGASASVPVICIGSLTLGGAGKTPTALAVARMLAETGIAPVFLTRGYGGRTEGPLRISLDRHTAADVGDEALLLARAFPTIVSRDRVAGADAARAAGAQVVVMDDGFYNPSLRKDFSALVVDAHYGVGNGLIFPAGPLRAPLAAQLAQADALVLVGEDTPAFLLDAPANERPLFRARLVPEHAAAEGLAGKPLLAFAGIGHPDKFFTTLRGLGADLRACRSFPDHHRYSEHDAEALLAEASRGGLALVTTEKDFVRLPQAGQAGRLRERSVTLPVSLAFEEPTALLRRMVRAISRAT